jgi:hypothetical protein
MHKRNRHHQEVDESFTPETTDENLLLKRYDFLNNKLKGSDEVHEEDIIPPFLR